MFCGNCGSQIEDGSVVCSKCGFKLVSDAKQVVKEMAEKANEIKAEAKAEAEEVKTEVQEQVNDVVAQVPENVQQNVDVPAVKEQSNNDNGNGGKKKSKLPLIITAAVVGVVAVLAIVFLCSSSLRNSIKKAFMSDDSYYRSVQKDSLMGMADTAINLYDSFTGSVDFNSIEYDINANLSVEKEAETLLDKIDNASRVDLTWLKKAALSIVLGKKDSNVYASMDLDINKEDIFEVDAKVNADDKMIYLGLPMLSDAYAAITAAGNTEDAEETSAEAADIAASMSKALPTKKELSKIAERYIGIFIDSISRVKVSEDKVVNVSGVSVDCTKVVVDFDAEELVDIDIKMLESLSSDNEVATIINRLSAVDGFELDYDKFLDEIDERIEKLKDYSRSDVEARIEAYIDSTGDVVSFNLIESHDGGSVGGRGYDYQYSYKLADKDGNYGFEASKQYVTASRTRVICGMRASGTRSGSKLTGTVDFINNGSTVAHLDYNELNISSLLSGELDGEFLFNMYERSGDKIMKNVMVKLAADDASFKKGEFTATIYDSKVAIAKFVIDYKNGSGSSVKMPSKTADVKDFNDIQDWVDGFKWKKMLDNMESAELPKKIVRAAQALSEGNYASLANILGINLGGFGIDFD